MKYRKLGMKALAGMLFLALVIIAATCITISVQYMKERMAGYRDTVFSFARMVAEMIDGDKALSYLETGGETGAEDDYYRQIQNFLDILQHETALKYCSVFVPYEDEIVYVWDSGEGEGVRPLGYHEAYMENGKEAVEKIFRRNPPKIVSVASDEVYGDIMSIYYPVFNSDGDPVVVVDMDLSMDDVSEVLWRFIAVIILSVLVVTIVSMGIFYAFIQRNIILPVGRLNKAAKNMVSSLEQDKIFHADIHTRDEIEELAETFAQMNRELRDYIKQLSAVTAEKERIGAELDIATQIQADMLPSIFPAFQGREEFDIYATMTPAKEVGGDFYDFFMVDDTHLAMVMADVSGKGVPAALFMVIGKTLIKDHTKPGSLLGEVFTEVNRLLCESNKEGLFITAFECVLDLETGQMVYVNAGHEPPFIAKHNEAYSKYIVTPQFVLAGFDGMAYTQGAVQIEPGDRVFLYTDGVTDATDTDERLYGMERLHKCLCANAEKNPQELLQAVKQDIDCFVGTAEQFDDITMLGMVFKKFAGSKSARDSLTLKAELSLLDDVDDFVNGFMERCGLDESLKARIGIVVDEIYTNICSYAYSGEPGDVTVDIETVDGKLRIVFVDSGCEYNPLEKEDPDITVPIEQREEGGLGIFMVKQIMDSVSYCRRDGKNVLSIEKGYVTGNGGV